jgi:hypothetical protein
VGGMAADEGLAHEERHEADDLAHDEGHHGEDQRLWLPVPGLASAQLVGGTSPKVDARKAARWSGPVRAIMASVIGSPRPPGTPRSLGSVP